MDLSLLDCFIKDEMMMMLMLLIIYVNNRYVVDITDESKIWVVDGSLTRKFFR